MKTIIDYGLLPRRYLLGHDIIFEDVADSEIINKREELDLDKYTPFHFHPYSAFDVAVKNKYSEEKFAYICIKRAMAEFNNFKVLVKHPLSQRDCVLYDYVDGIAKIDWDTMEKAGATDVKEVNYNPKRMQREVRKQMHNIGLKTKSRQALKLQQEQLKIERKIKNHKQQEIDKKRKFELKQRKRKEKHRGR